MDAIFFNGWAVLGRTLLIGMQFVISWTSTRMPWLRRVVTGEPRLLLRQGKMLEPALRDTRITREEVRAAVRAAGLAEVESVAAVVLETDGSFSVIAGGAGASFSSLEGVK